jgi:hypothetical protein
VALLGRPLSGVAGELLGSTVVGGGSGIRDGGGGGLCVCVRAFVWGMWGAHGGKISQPAASWL